MRVDWHERRLGKARLWIGRLGIAVSQIVAGVDWHDAGYGGRSRDRRK